MPGLDPGIHDLNGEMVAAKSWVPAFAGTTTLIAND